MLRYKGNLKKALLFALTVMVIAMMGAIIQGRVEKKQKEIQKEKKLIGIVNENT